MDTESPLFTPRPATTERVDPIPLYTPKAPAVGDHRVLARLSMFPEVDGSQAPVYKSVSSSNPPSFDGSNYKDWNDDFFLWMHATDIHPSKIGALLYQTSLGRAKYVIKDIPKEQIVDPSPDDDFPNLTKGVAAILKAYTTHFSKTDLHSETQYFDSFSRLKREGKFKKWADYISEFRIRQYKVTSSGVSLPNSVLVHTFIRNANLSSQESKFF